MNKVAVAIIKKNNEFLLVRRKKREGNLYWQFPAGSILKYESAKKASIREAFEETGVICKAVKKFGKRVHPDTHAEIYYWLCFYIDGKAIVKDAEEIDDVKWCKAEEIKELITSDLFEPVSNYLFCLHFPQ